MKPTICGLFPTNVGKCILVIGGCQEKDKDKNGVPLQC
jgi:hypothetical protein